MGRNLSAEEVEQEHIGAMGPTLGPLFHALYNEVTWLHAKWLEYRKLYAHSPQRLELLNKVARFFFYTVQHVLWRDVLLHIARLTDPPKQGKGGEHENLTLLRLKEAVSTPELAATLSDLLEDAKTKSSFARDWRNKRLAHHDLSVALRSPARQLEGVSRKQIEGALAAFRAVLNHIHFHYFQGEVGFEHFIAGNDADSLVAYLRIADQFESQKMRRLREGRPLPEDFETPPEA